MSGSSCSSLPDLSTQLDTNWTDTLSQAKANTIPVKNLSSTISRGFGIVDGSVYDSISQCRHPGFDFFDLAGQPALAIRDGIVVGMGRFEDGVERVPAKWGATVGGYNLVIRQGGHFMLYGHLSQIDNALYIGKRVQAGDIVGIIANQGTNSHIHLEVSAFRTQADANLSLYPRFGAIASGGVSNPYRMVDLIHFVLNAGTLSSPVTRASLCKGSNITLNVKVGSGAYQGGINYKTNDGVAGACFDTQLSTPVYSPAQCLSPQPSPQP